MAKTLKLKIKDLGLALISLEEVILKKKTKMTRDSTIKRFEYCFELAWKTTKEFLRQDLGIEAFSPKDCFRELRRNQIFSDEKAEKLLKMTDDRNRIIHTYDEKFSELIYFLIKKEYRPLLSELYAQIRSRKTD